MQSIRTWFLQPYPFARKWGSIFRMAFWAGLFVTSFLFFFKPFGTQISPGAEGEYLIICTYFGLVTVGITLLINSTCFFFPKIFDEEKWTVWKEILYNLFFISCIGLGNLVLANALWGVPLNGRMFWIWQGFTFAVGIFPTFFGAFYTQMKWSKKFAAEAAALHLPPIHHTVTGTTQTLVANPVVFVGENQNETISLQAAQIAYLSAQDNYVQIYYFEADALKSRMIRATLRKMEETLADWPQFFRCHRTYVVNFDKIEKVSGNAQGYRLHLEGLEETLPVSRNLNEVIRSRLNGL